MHFQGEMIHFFFKNKALRSESVKLIYLSNFNNLINGLLILKTFINSFASQCLVFEKKMNPFSLKIHQIWHMSFSMTILPRKFTKTFLLKLSHKNSFLKFDAFSRKNGSFFLRNDALRSESINIKVMLIKIIFINLFNFSKLTFCFIRKAGKNFFL